MTQEEKQILLIDLCARLPYGVKGLALGGKIDSIKTLSPTEYPWVKTSSGLSCHLGTGQFKPYLRPMSSMTEEELEELLNTEDIDFDGKGELVRKAMMAYSEGNRLESNSLFSMQYAKAIDWLNKNHFDYRGLIEKGLALKAPEDIYRKEKEQ